MVRPLLPAFVLLLVASFALPVTAQAPSGPIQDNSFLVEEAYNQQKGVVQHINTFSYFTQSHDWMYTFTQEWPMPHHERHQLSYTLAYFRIGDSASHGPGIGDALLNYRYQLIGSGDTRIAFAPRLSLILPAGDSDYGRGYGGTGLQTNLPLSTILSRKLVMHWNAGATWVPHAHNAAGDTAGIVSYNAGHSVIWLATDRFNGMLESVFTSMQTVSAPGRVQWSNSAFVNPGVRWAYNFQSGLQIVPGIAIPIGVGPSVGEKGVLVYLSFEHPLSALRRR